MNEHQETIDYLASTPDIPSDRLKAIQQWLVEHGAEDATDEYVLSMGKNRLRRPAMIPARL